MADLLSRLVADGVIDEVLARLKSGKEADIYLVQHAGEVVAAKLYKEREFRSFKNNSAYKEGRAVRNSRTQRAMDKGSRFGQAAEEDAWKAKEFEALTTLFATGMRVPKPYLFYEGVLLMEAVIDPEGHPAPRLIDAPIPRERAVEFYADLRQQVVRMLLADLIHGDLSPYNVLLAWNGPTVIDFPQVVGAAHNSQAEFFFTRDLETIRKFFAAIDPALNAHSGDAREIWRAYIRRELNADFLPSGRPEAAAPRQQRTMSPGPRQGGGPPGGGQRHGGGPRAPRGGQQGGGPNAPREQRAGQQGGAPNVPREQREGQQGVAGGSNRSSGKARDSGPREGGRPGGQPRSGGPAVSYLGASPAPAPSASGAELTPPGAPAGQKRKRRRGRRRGGGGAPNGGGTSGTGGSPQS